MQSICVNYDAVFAVCNHKVVVVCSIMWEELAAFCLRALLHPQAWVPTVAALVLRCHVERRLQRRANRALQQLEVCLFLFNL